MATSSTAAGNGKMGWGWEWELEWVRSAEVQLSATKIWKLCKQNFELGTFAAGAKRNEKHQATIRRTFRIKMAEHPSQPCPFLPVVNCTKFSTRQMVTELARNLDENDDRHWSSTGIHSAYNNKGVHQLSGGCWVQPERNLVSSVERGSRQQTDQRCR